MPQWFDSYILFMNLGKFDNKKSQCHNGSIHIPLSEITEAENGICLNATMVRFILYYWAEWQSNPDGSQCHNGSIHIELL